MKDIYRNIYNNFSNPLLNKRFVFQFEGAFQQMEEANQKVADQEMVDKALNAVKTVVAKALNGKIADLPAEEAKRIGKHETFKRIAEKFANRLTPKQNEMLLQTIDERYGEPDKPVARTQHQADKLFSQGKRLPKQPNMQVAPAPTGVPNVAGTPDVGNAISEENLRNIEKRNQLQPKEYTQEPIKLSEADLDAVVENMKLTYEAENLKRTGSYSRVQDTLERHIARDLMKNLKNSGKHVQLLQFFPIKVAQSEGIDFKTDYKDVKKGNRTYQQGICEFSKANMKKLLQSALNANKIARIETRR